MKDATIVLCIGVALALITSRAFLWFLGADFMWGLAGH